MIAMTSADIPACPVLPMEDEPFLRAARDIMLIADGLLMMQGAPLLALSLPSDGWGGAYPIVMWDDHLRTCQRRIHDTCESLMMAPALDAMCLAADALYERLLAWRWTEVAARGLCAVTDGTGLALIGEAPSGAAAWLPQLPARAIPVLPFRTDGAWRLLASEEVRLTVH